MQIKVVPMKNKFTIFTPIRNEQEALRAISFVAKGVFVLAAIHVLMMFSNGWRHIIDVIVFVFCGYNLFRWHSKGAAAVLLILSVINTIATIIYVSSVHRDGPNNLVMAFAILYISIRAVEATFKLHGDLAFSPETIDEQLPDSTPAGTFSLQPPKTETIAPETNDVKEWYVLGGIKGRAISQSKVKKLYETAKSKIRGPFSQEEIGNYYKKGMITRDTILYKKGDSEWRPLGRHDIMCAESTADARSIDDSGQEWFVLVGLKGKTLDSDYIKGLYDINKVRVKGPFLTATLVSHFQSGTIGNETMVNKKGDRDWKPLSKHNISQIDESIRTDIFGVASHRPLKGRFDRLVIELYYFLFSWKKTVAFSLIALCISYTGYDYYNHRPEQIYERIKKSVVLISSESDKGLITGLGSGFILDEGGIVATNLHVIDNAISLRIKTGDYRTLDIDGVVYFDPDNDIALLKIKKGSADVTCIPRGKTSDIKIGERIYTIGNPAGLEFSLSEGLISGKRDTDPIDMRHRELLQITAPISPGNSGGPLLNNSGRVIGVTSMASKNDYQNLNFATPINLIDNACKHKDIQMRFLPPTPKWELLGTDDNKTPGYDRYQVGESNRIVNAYYNPESVASFGEKRKRFWAKFNIKQNYNSSFQVTTNTEVDGYSLIEVDCKSNKYKYNVGIVQSEGKSAVRKSDFSNGGNWKEMDEDDKKVLSRICAMN